MAHELDIAAKALLREVPEAIVALALGGRAIRSVHPEEKELASLSRLMDKLFRVELESESADHEPLYLHLEVQANWESNVPERVFDYWSLARRAHPRLASVVICLKRGSKQGEPLGRYEASQSGTTLRFEFSVIRVWGLKADELLRSGSSALLPLLPFTAGASHERVHQALRVLNAVEPLKRRAELQATLAAFAGNVFPDVHWLARIPREILMESTAFREIHDEGRLAGERRLLALQLRARLGEHGASFEDRLGLCTPALLEEAATLFATVRSDDEFTRALEGLLPQAE